MVQWLPLSPIQKFFSKFLSTITILCSADAGTFFLNKGITIKLIDKRRKDEQGNLYKKLFTPMKVSKNTSVFWIATERPSFRSDFHGGEKWNTSRSCNDLQYLIQRKHTHMSTTSTPTKGEPFV